MQKRASSAVPPRHRGLFICMVVEVLVDERRKIMKVGSHQVAIEENGECRSVDRNYLLCINFFEWSNKMLVSIAIK